jgi:NADH:ubiquinone oxidoreductase subunit C
MTALLDTLHQELGTTNQWTETGGVHWLDPGLLSVRELCMEMIAARARFITITAYELPKDEGIRLEYHWDLVGQLLGFPFLLKTEPGENPRIESIFDLCEAVDWIEREIHEEYKVDFTGRVYEPLLMREGDKLGVNLREIANICAPETGAPGQEEVKK